MTASLSARYVVAREIDGLKNGLRSSCRPAASPPETVAAVLADPDRFAGRRIVVVTTERNVDPDRLLWTASQAIVGRGGS
jgi:hypothetical protein